MIGSYGEINHVAHKIVQPMWSEPIVIEEKVDGSQVSWGRDENGELMMRSKGKQLFEGAPDAKMFREAIESIKERADLLVPGHIFRGEYLRTVRHNSLCYNRIPKGHIVLFDIELSMGEYATPEQRRETAEFIGLESIPVLYEGVWDKGLAGLKEFLESESFLGGPKIEGVVAKCYTKYLNAKPMMSKLVSEEFKEVHSKLWKKSNPSQGDIIEQLVTRYKTEARWRKAVEHLRDEGSLTNSPRDIGPLLKEVSADVKKEEAEAIKEELFKVAYPKISRGITAGFVEWYKESLLEEDK